MGEPIGIKTKNKTKTKRKTKNEIQTKKDDCDNVLESRKNN